MTHAVPTRRSFDLDHPRSVDVERIVHSIDEPHGHILKRAHRFSAIERSPRGCLVARVLPEEGGTVGLHVLFEALQLTPAGFDAGSSVLHIVEATVRVLRAEELPRTDTHYRAGLLCGAGHSQHCEPNNRQDVDLIAHALPVPDVPDCKVFKGRLAAQKTL